MKETDTPLTGFWGSGGQEGIDTITFPIESNEPILKCLESGRIISHKDQTDFLQVGPNKLDNWIIMGLKGRETTHGVVVAELDIDDVTDAMSILANYSGVLLDNLVQQVQVEE